MNMMDAVKTVLGKYATFSGRAGRAEFWWWTLFLVLLFLAISLVEGAILAPMLGSEAFSPDAGQPLGMLATVLVILPALAVDVRRLHDIDKSGWWYLIAFVPIIGSLILIYWFIQPGTEGENRFG